MRQTNSSNKIDYQHNVHNVSSARKLIEPNSVVTQPSLALSAIFVSVPIAIAALFALLIAGFSVFQALLFAWLIQFGIFLIAIGWGYFQQNSVSPVARSSANTVEHPSDTAMIWREYLDGRSDCSLRIAFVAHNDTENQRLGKSLIGMGHIVVNLGSDGPALERLQENAYKWDLLIFDLDFASNIETGIDVMLMFRANCATLPVLLLSSDALHDEFSDHRRSIGDATLRKPVSDARLLDGITAVGHNFCCQVQKSRV